MAVLCTFFDHAADLARQQGISLEEALSRVRGMGIQGLEVAQNSLGADPEDLGRMLRRAGLRVSTIPAYFHFNTDPDVAAQAAPVLEAARVLGVRQVLVIPGFIPPEVTDPGERRAHRDAMAQGINRLAALAEPLGVELIMEDYDNEAAPFATAAGVRGFLDDCPALGCCFDTGNFRFMAEETALEAYDRLRDRVRYVHLKDRAYAGAPGERGRPARDGQALYAAPVGGGEMPMAELLTRLQADGYRGPYSIEHYGAPDMEGYLRQSVQWVQAALG